MIKKINKYLIKEASIAYKKGEIPVGAVIVYKNKILSKAHNERQGKKNILGHAEILAIQKAERKIGDWRLNDCVLYVTLKPCEMCKTIINESRIQKVYYWLESNTKITKSDCVDYQQTAEDSNYQMIFKDFFKNMR